MENVTKKSVRRPVRVLLAAGAFVVLVAGALIGYRLWYNSAHFISTDNAQVTAALVQVGSVNAGRIVRLNVDVGAAVAQGQAVATVDIPTVLSASDITGTAKVGFKDVQEQLVDVTAPISGVVAARWATAGDTVPAGQPIVTLMDPRNVWVTANVEETKIGRVRPGQYVDVYVDSLQRTLSGRVDAVTPVTAGTFSLLPAQNTTGNYTKVVQIVPVKIVLDDARAPLVPGSSVQVTIHLGQ